MRKFVFYLASVCMLFGLLAGNLYAFPLMHFSLYNSEGMVDENGQLLPEHARVEFIWAGADGQMNDPVLDPSSPLFLRPGGDDQIVVNATFTELVFGIGYSLDKASTPADQYYGHIDLFIEGLQADLYMAAGADPNVPWDDKFYVRFFTSIDPPQTFYEENHMSWGESELLSLPAHDPMDFTGMIYEPLDFFTGTPLITDKMIPEPTTLLLGLVSLLFVKIRTKK